MATGNMHETFGKVRPRGFRVMRSDRETDRQTNRHTHHNTLQPYRSEVVKLLQSTRLVSTGVVVIQHHS